MNRILTLIALTTAATALHFARKASSANTRYEEACDELLLAHEKQQRLRESRDAWENTSRNLFEALTRPTTESGAWIMALGWAHPRGPYASADAAKEAAEDAAAAQPGLLVHMLDTQGTVIYADEPAWDWGES